MIQLERRPSIDVGDNLSVLFSVEKFTTQSSEQIDALVNNYSKKSDRPSGNSFSIISSSGLNPNYPYSPYGDFARDGAAGFILRTKSQRKQDKFLDLAMICFNFPSATNENPLIVQLQTFSPKINPSEDAADLLKEEAKLVLEKFRWEKALVALMLEWARRERFPFVYLQPGSQNRYCGSGLTMERAKLRYDVTAKRMGFREVDKGQDKGLLRLKLD